jgi:pyruvate,water dikinase
VRSWRKLREQSFIESLSRSRGSSLSAYIIPFEKLGRHDVEVVGGKNSSLGEMISHLAKMGVSVPGGFATTAQAYRDFLQHEGSCSRPTKR